MKMLLTNTPNNKYYHNINLILNIRNVSEGAKLFAYTKPKIVLKVL
jgi:hypothetical protein